MQVINLLVYPNAALVLIYAHAPAAHDVTAVIADIVGEFHEFFLEISKRLSVIAFGKFSNKVERVRFNAFLEILKTIEPAYLFVYVCQQLHRYSFAEQLRLPYGPGQWLPIYRV